MAEEVLELVEQADPPIDWFCLEASSVADVDYSAAETLRQVADQLADHDAKLVLSGLADDVRDELDTFGTLELVGDDAVFATVHDVIVAHRQQAGGPRTDVVPPDPGASGETDLDEAGDPVGA